MHFDSEWETDSEFGRTFYIEDDDGTVIKTFDDSPTLDQLRTVEQHTQTRINLSNLGVPCVNCASEITERFAADPRGNLLCWDCAVAADHGTEAGIRVNSDPSEATISQSSLYEKSLCDHVLNVATGCRHGCKFCYVPTSQGYESRSEILADRVNVSEKQREWGSYLMYRDDLPERLHEELEAGQHDNMNRTERGREVVMLSSGTDPYQDRRAAQISRAAVDELISHDIPVRVLSRSSIVAQDIDLFLEASDLVKVGSSIPSFNREIVGTLEPGAPPPLTRWQTLDMLQLEGVPVFVSMSPTYPTLDEHGLHRLLTRFMAIRPNVVFHEPINPRGKNFDMIVESLEDAGLPEEAAEFRRLEDTEEWVKYALKHLNRVQQKAREIGAPPIHSWPDRDLLRATEGSLRDQLAAMRQSPSPESFDGNSSPEHSDAHSPLFDSYDEIKHLVNPENVR